MKEEQNIYGTETVVLKRMKNKLFYFIKNGFKNIISHKMMSIASVCIMAASLALLGVLIAAGININSFMNKLGDSCEINVYLKSDADGRSISDIEGDLKGISGVSEVKFYSREERLKKVTEEVYGKEGYVFEDGQNPLRDSYLLIISDLSKSMEVSNEAQNIKGVEEVIQNKDIIGGIDMLTKAMKNVGIWIMIIFMLLSLFILSNTIKIGMASCAEEIGIMKIVGATDGFIRGPFIVQGVILGIVGALIASIAILLGYGVVISKVSGLITSDIISFASVKAVAAVIVPVFLGSGAVIGVVASYTAAGRYFK